MVEGARLESVCRGNSTVGSNPTLSANLRQALASLAAAVRRPRHASRARRLSTVARSAEVHVHELMSSHARYSASPLRIPVTRIVQVQPRDRRLSLQEYDDAGRGSHRCHPRPPSRRGRDLHRQEAQR